MEKEQDQAKKAAPRRRFRWLRRYGVRAFMLLVIVALTFYIFLAEVAGRLVLPAVMARLAPMEVESDIRQFGFRSLDLADVKFRLAPGGAPLEADSIRLDYSIGFGGVRINRMVLSGLKLEIETDAEGRWRLGGKQLGGEGAASAASGHTEPFSLARLAMRIEAIVGEVQIKQAELVLYANEERVEIPFNLHLQLPYGGQTELTAELDLGSGRDRLAGVLRYDPYHERGNFAFDGRCRVPRRFSIIGGHELFGRFGGSLSGSWKGDGIPSMAAVKFELTNLSLRYRDYAFDREGTPTLRLDWNGSRLDGRLTEGIRVKWGNYAAVVGDCDVFAIPGGEGEGLEAGVKTALDLRLSADHALRAGTESRFRYRPDSGSWEGDGTWQLKGSAGHLSSGGDFALATNPAAAPGSETFRFRLSAETPAQSWPLPWFDSVFEMSASRLLAEVKRVKGEAAWKVSASNLIPEVKWSSTVAGKSGVMLKEVAFNAAYDGVTPDISFAAGGIRAGAGNFAFSGGETALRLRHADGAWRIGLDAGDIALDGKPLSIGHFAVELPWGGAERAEGVIRLEKGSVFGSDLDFSAPVIWDGAGWDFTGILQQNLAPAAKPELSVRLGLKPLFQSRMEFIVPRVSFNLADGEKLHPSLAGWKAAGELEFDSEYAFGFGSNSGRAALRLARTGVENEALKLHASGIEGRLELNNLPRLDSTSRQKLRVASAAIGPVELEKLLLEFQLLPGELLVNEASLAWCGGTIATYGLRLHKGIDEVKADLFCDGLRVADCINTFGFAKASGEGRIFGRIPVRLGKEGIHFEPGYLYSEPGVAEGLKLQGLEKTLGLDPLAAGGTELDIAVEAMRDFRYDWVKLDFASEGEYLNLKTRFNGRPNRDLPFSFNQKENRFVRINRPGARFLGIQLDLNSRVPLNQLLELQETYKKLTGGKK